MFIWFSSHKCNYLNYKCKAQLAPFFIALVTIIIIAMLFTINLSRISVHKVYTTNSVDAGALAGASQLAFAYDQIVYLSWVMYQEYLVAMVAMEELHDQVADSLENVIQTFEAAVGLMGTAMAAALIPYAGQAIYIGLMYAASALFYAAFLMLSYVVARQYGGYEAAAEEYWKSLQELYTTIMDNVTLAFTSAQDLAKDYSFLNSGISQYLSDDLTINGNPIDADGDGEKDAPSQADEFSFFIQDDETPDTFCWRDARATSNPIQGSSLPGGIDCQPSPYAQIDDSTSHRFHVAQVTVSEESAPERYEVLTTAGDVDDIEDKIIEGYAALTGAIGSSMYLSSLLADTASTAGEVPTCGAGYVWHYIICFVYVCICLIPTVATAYSALTSTYTGIAAGVLTGSLIFLDNAIDDIRDYFQEGGKICTTGGSLGDTIPITITDVEHNGDFQIDVETFQEHQGEDIGLWQLKYPRTTARAQASFACDTSLCDDTINFNTTKPGCDPGECGNICNHTFTCMNGIRPCQGGHNPVLISVD